eukprot:m.270641 g.270641  ORF g.270641 m.270641 type:complete len:462 (+) comp90850_c0_seq1:342-1727(+)
MARMRPRVSLVPWILFLVSLSLLSTWPTIVIGTTSPTPSPTTSTESPTESPMVIAGPQVCEPPFPICTNTPCVVTPCEEKENPWQSIGRYVLALLSFVAGALSWFFKFWFTILTNVKTIYDKITGGKTDASSSLSLSARDIRPEFAATVMTLFVLGFVLKVCDFFELISLTTTGLMRTIELAYWACWLYIWLLPTCCSRDTSKQLDRSNALYDSRPDVKPGTLKYKATACCEGEETYRELLSAGLEEELDYTKANFWQCARCRSCMYTFSDHDIHTLYRIEKETSDNPGGAIQALDARSFGKLEWKVSWSFFVLRHSVLTLISCVLAVVAVCLEDRVEDLAKDFVGNERPVDDTAFVTFYFFGLLALSVFLTPLLVWVVQDYLPKPIVTKGYTFAIAEPPSTCKCRAMSDSSSKLAWYSSTPILHLYKVVALETNTCAAGHMNFVFSEVWHFSIAPSRTTS